MEITRVINFGLIEKPLRNIRMQLDEDVAVFDLIPELLVSNNNFDPLSKELSPTMNLLKECAEIIESTNFLRIEFNRILGLALNSDIDVDLYGGLHDGWEIAPKLQKSNSYYPFLEIQNSPWKKQLPDWRGCDEPEIKHYRLISMESSFDVLAWQPTGKWISST